MELKEGRTAEVFWGIFFVKTVLIDLSWCWFGVAWRGILLYPCSDKRISLLSHKSYSPFLSWKKCAEWKEVRKSGQQQYFRLKATAAACTSFISPKNLFFPAPHVSRTRSRGIWFSRNILATSILWWQQNNLSLPTYSPCLTYILGKKCQEIEEDCYLEIKTCSIWYMISLWK